MSITIVGLGPGDPEKLTRQAWRILSEAPIVYLRTAQHVGIEQLPIRQQQSFDAWYDRAKDFASLYQQIAEEVVRLGGQPGGVVYAVPGHPMVGETTVLLIIKLAEAAQLPVTIVDGLSFLEPMLSQLRLDGLGGLQVHDAEAVSRMHHPPLNPDTPTILAQVYSQAVASDLKLTLANQYPEDHEVLLVHGAGTAEATIEPLPLHELDHSEEIDHLTSLYLPPLARKGSFEYFQEIMAHLRAPEGCPWDKAQTHDSLRAYLLEETYEVLEALDKGDAAEIKKELGDLLLQIVFHAQIATEEGSFQMAEIIANVAEKMIRRHPHVWGTTQVSGAEEVHKNWDQIKAAENAGKNPDQPLPSAIDGVPTAMPALAHAASIHQRAARIGFEWPNVDGVVEKLHEELAEVLSATDQAQREEEIGDLLSATVNLARWHNVDPETAMRNNNLKFSRRFRGMEGLAHAQGKALKDLGPDEMEALWQAMKATEPKPSA
jgi:tetrapyrrole methylase family protein / MazG family protein